jgi:hypothetical protein
VGRKLRRERKLKCRIRALDMLSLSGIIHISGDAGVGKTLLAAAIASEAATSYHVEWICTDQKLSFILHLKRNVSEEEQSRIHIQIPSNYEEAGDCVCNLKDVISEKTSLVVIDSITKVLDMSQQEQDMWGRQFIEDVLPMLAALSSVHNLTILLISESRFMGKDGLKAVFNEEVTKWSDHHIEVKRESYDKTSRICRFEEPNPIAYILIDKTGKISIDENGDLKEVVQGCSEQAQSST